MSFTQAQQRQAYRRMLRIRKFEEEGTRQFMAGRIPGAYHANSGQEACIVGACMALSDSDGMTRTHRSHGHPIGKGADLKALMAELIGKATGICKGCGSSMHLFDNSVGIVGESAFVGGGIPLATSCGLSAKVRRKDQIAKQTESCGMSGVVVDGPDASSVNEVANEAAGRARRGEGPTLIEVKTYRLDEHNEGLFVSSYRSNDEIQAYKTHRDPIVLSRQLMLAHRCSDGELQAVENEAAASVVEAIRFDEESPLPDPEDLYDHLYSIPIRRICKVDRVTYYKGCADMSTAFEKQSAKRIFR